MMAMILSLYGANEHKNKKRLSLSKDWDSPFAIVCSYAFGMLLLEVDVETNCEDVVVTGIVRIVVQCSCLL